MRAVSLSSPEVIEAIRTRTIPVHADGFELPDGPWRALAGEDEENLRLLAEVRALYSSVHAQSQLFLLFPTGGVVQYDIMAKNARRLEGGQDPRPSVLDPAGPRALVLAATQGLRKPQRPLRVDPDWRVLLDLPAPPVQPAAEPAPDPTRLRVVSRFPAEVTWQALQEVFDPEHETLYPPVYGSPVLDGADLDEADLAALASGDIPEPLARKLLGRFCPDYMVMTVAPEWVRSAQLEAQPQSPGLALLEGQAVLEYPRRIRHEWRSTVRVEFEVEGYVQSEAGRVLDLCLVARGRATNETGRSVPFDAMGRLGD